MKITVRFFALLREQAGTSEFALELNDAATVATTRDDLVRQFPQISKSIATARFAINREYASLDSTLRDGDELALIPPVSGG